MKFNKLSLAAIFSFLLSVHVIFAQSGRPIPSPTPEIPAPAEDTNTYPPCEKGLEEILYIPPKKIKIFIEEINRLGNCGYRLEKLDKLRLPSEATVDDLYVFGVVKLDAGNSYEYDWFNANTHGSVVTNANKQGEKGFYFRRNMMFAAGACDAEADQEREERKRSETRGDLANSILGSNGSIFIFERKNRLVRRIEYRVLNGTDERGEKALARNQEILNNYVAEGFRPVGIYYMGIYDVFVIVVERDKEIKPEGEYRIVRYIFNPSKLFTQHSQEGYKPVFVGWYFAVLHRKTNEFARVSYESADKLDGIIKNLPKWSGANYQARGLGLFNSGCDLSLNKLFFAVPLDDKAERYEQKFLKMTNISAGIKKKEAKSALTAPPPPEIVQEFYGLLKEGYVVRDVFENGEINIIFEREKK